MSACTGRPTANPLIYSPRKSPGSNPCRSCPTTARSFDPSAPIAVVTSSSTPTATRCLTSMPRKNSPSNCTPTNCYSFITKDSSPPIPAVTSAARKSATPTTQRNCAPTQEGPRDQTLLSSFLAISSHAEPYARQLEEKRLNP